jgi:hypothetical protein
MNQYPCHYCRHCFASRIALKQRCRPAAAQVHPEASDGRCGRSGTRHRLRDERLEQFDERVDGLDGDGADAARPVARSPCTSAAPTTARPPVILAADGGVLSRETHTLVRSRQLMGRGPGR